MRNVAVVLTLLLSSSIAAFAGAATPAPPPAVAAAAPSIPFTKYRLDNGLEVILAPDKRLPVVAVNLWYHVGAANETPDRTGFAHLFEHMMFTGTKHVARGEAERLLEAAGGADSNATTGFDSTKYYDTVPANQLALALWTHADRMGYLLDALDQKALANQQDVVRNERRETTENRPYGIVDEAVFRNLFPVGHPYRPYIMGSHADIQAARLADVRDFFKRYYRPNNATLTIVGDFDAATQTLCGFVGIPWSAEVRRFDKTAQARGVSTASAGQVRKGLYDGSGQWRPYARQLEPVLPILAPWIERFGYA